MAAAYARRWADEEILHGSGPSGFARPFKSNCAIKRTSAESYRGRAKRLCTQRGLFLRRAYSSRHAGNTIRNQRYGLRLCNCQSAGIDEQPEIAIEYRTH